jgi:cellulose synthase/poly-beta-1,6-N-acetylglucosamine synthase-like glycosyltransferase
VSDLFAASTPWTPLEIIGTVAGVFYALAMVGLAIYAIHGLWLLFKFGRIYKKTKSQWAAELDQPLPPESELPLILVQVPVFNERDVVERMLEHVAKLEWPRAKLEIQLLDDSTDDSVDIGRAAVARLQDRGINAISIHRTDRTGYKAGALENGMKQSKAEFIAIFDADFVPEPDFLKKAYKPFVGRPRLALVQGRWEHLNQHENMLTEAQAIGIDGHFGIEQNARAFSDLTMNFNGTCGMWRRAAIDDAGGWEHETLTEDLDLSYRAQLKGWECTYRADLAVPGELPADINAWLNQQFRWAKGSQQCTKKLLGRVLRSDWNWERKLAAVIHLSHYLVHPLMVVSMLTAPLALWLAPKPPMFLLIIGTLAFVIGVISPIVTYTASQYTLAGRKARQLFWKLPMLTSLGTGMALTITVAVWEAWIGKQSEFVRTPKAGSTAKVKASSYKSKGRTGIPEILLAAWSIFGVLVSWQVERAVATPLLFLFAGGFFSIGLMCLRDHVQRQPKGPETNPLALAAIVILGVISMITYAGMASGTGEWSKHAELFAVLGLIVGAAYLGAVWLVRFQSRAMAVAIIVFALIFRVIAMGQAPSQEMSRAVIDGRMAIESKNPYAPQSVAIVQEGAQAAFVPAGQNQPASVGPVSIGAQTIVAKIFYDHNNSDLPLWSMRAFHALCEVLALGLLAGIILGRGLPLSFLVLAAWNPIGPMWLVGQGYGETVMLLLMALGLWLHARRQELSGIVVMSLAVLTKPFAAITLVPQLLEARRLWWIAIPPVLAVAAFLPFVSGFSVNEFVRNIQQDQVFYGVLEPMVSALWESLGVVAHRQALTLITLASIFTLGASILVWRYQSGRSRYGAGDPFALATKLAVLLAITQPMLCPWHLAMLVFLLPFLPHRAFVFWTAACAAIFCLNGLEMNGQKWASVPWTGLLTHGPFLLLLAWDVVAKTKPLELVQALSVKQE